MLRSFTSDETPGHPTSRWNCQLSEKAWCLSSDLFCIQRSNWKEGEQLRVLMWMFCLTESMLYLDGKRHFDQTVACWEVKLTTCWSLPASKRQASVLMRIMNECGSDIIFISWLLNFKQPTQALWILLLQSVWRFTNWCVWCTTAEDAFPPCFSILYSYHFSQLYQSVLQPLNCRKWGKRSNPSHHNLIHFRLLGVTI